MIIVGVKSPGTGLVPTGVKQGILGMEDVAVENGAAVEVSEW